MPSTARHAPSQARAVDVVTPGYYRMPITRGGWSVPCQIELTTVGWRATIDGFSHAADLDPWRAEGVSSIHAYGEKIDRATFDWLLEVKAWAAKHNPEHPCLWPRRAIDFGKLRPLYPRRTTAKWESPPCR